MVAPNNPLVARISMLFTRDARTFVNTFHLARSTGWTLAQLQQAVVDTASWWSLYYKQSQGAGVALAQIQGRLYDPAQPLAYDLNVTPPEPGTIASTLEAANATATMSWRTGLAGRKYRGRMYVPSLVESGVNANDTLNAALLALLANAANRFVGTWWSNQATPVVFHRSTNGLTLITSFVLDAILDSQRRRLPGRGR